MSVQDSREDLLFNLRYEACYGLRMERLLTRCQIFIRCVTLLVATSAVAAYGDSVASSVLSVGGVVLMAITIFDIVVDPGRLAASCRDQVKATTKVLKRADAMTDDELRAAEIGLTQTELPELKSLSMPVFNEVASQVGRPDAIERVSWVQRLVYAMA